MNRVRQDISLVEQLERTLWRFNHKEWLIDLSEDFDSRVEEGKLIYWKAGITVIAVPFRLPEETDKLSLLKQIQEKIPG